MVVSTFTVLSSVVVGDMPVNTSGWLSTISYSCCTVTVREPRPVIWTLRTLVPISEKLSLMLWVMPLPKPTMTMTAVTPMMMPSMVRTVRNLLLQIFLTASWKVS